MQLAADLDLAAALAAPERDMFRAKLLVDWGGDGTFTHPLSDVSGWCTEMPRVSRALTGGLPVEASQIEGSVAASLTATLRGEVVTAAYPDGLDALVAFSAHREDSPLWRVPTLGVGVRFDAGVVTDVGVRWVRRFTGTVRSLRVSSSDREVTLAALDPADGLRAPITLPAYGLNRTEVLRSGHRFLVNPQWTIDFVLRRNGIYASPPAHPAAQISCTGHGAYAAEAGRNAVPRGTVGITIPADQSWWVPGSPQFGMLASRGVWSSTHAAYQEFFSREPFQPRSGTGVGLGAWIKIGTGMSDLTGGDTYKVLFHLMPLVDHDAFRFELGIFSDGKIGAYVWDSIGGFKGSSVTPGADAWRYVGVHWQFISSTQVTIRWRIDGTTYSGTYAIPALRSAFAQAVQMTAWTCRAWSNLHVWYDGAAPAAPWPGESHTSQATIAAGLNEMFHLPDVVTEDSWKIVKEVGEAEYALCGFDEWGEFYFAPRGWVTTDPGTVEAEITADRALIDLASEVTIDSVRNVVTTETAPRALTFNNAIIDSKDKLDFESPVGVWEFDVALPHGAIGTTTQTIPQLVTAQWSDAVLWGYVAVRADLESEEIAAGSITVTYVQVGDRLGRIRVANYSQYPVRFCTTSGSAALRVQGWALRDEPVVLETYRNEGSISKYKGERAFPIPASRWRQQPAPLREVAGGLLAQLSLAVPVIEGLSALHDPRRQLGDTVRLRDPAGIAADLRATIVKINPGSSDVTDSLAVRPIGPPGYGLVGDPELGIVGQTLVVAP